MTTVYTGLLAEALAPLAPPQRHDAVRAKGEVFTVVATYADHIDAVHALPHGRLRVVHLVAADIEEVIPCRTS